MCSEQVWLWSVHVSLPVYMFHCALLRVPSPTCALASIRREMTHDTYLTLRPNLPSNYSAKGKTQRQQWASLQLRRSIKREAQGLQMHFQTVLRPWGKKSGKKPGHSRRAQPRNLVLFHRRGQDLLRHISFFNSPLLLTYWCQIGMRCHVSPLPSFC